MSLQTPKRSNWIINWWTLKSVKKCLFIAKYLTFWDIHRPPSTLSTDALRTHEPPVINIWHSRYKTVFPLNFNVTPLAPAEGDDHNDQRCIEKVVWIVGHFVEHFFHSGLSSKKENPCSVSFAFSSFPSSLSWLESNF